MVSQIFSYFSPLLFNKQQVGRKIIVRRQEGVGTGRGRKDRKGKKGVSHRPTLDASLQSDSSRKGPNLLGTTVLLSLPCQLPPSPGGELVPSVLPEGRG